MKTQKVPDFCIPLTSKQIQKNSTLAEEAVHLAPYAIMCNNAYARGEYFIPLPEGWKEIPEFRKEIPNIGLALAVFEKYENTKLTEVVVAFRGTDGMKDWIQNLIPLRRIQVVPASEDFERILRLYENQGPKVTTTGHSLGGGLALHMSFKYPNIDTIVFNSSPVTKAGLKIQEGSNRISAWESGEFLQIVRNLISLVRPRWYPIRRIEFRFIHGWTITQHGMELFALNITKLGATKSHQLKALTDSWFIR